MIGPQITATCVLVIGLSLGLILGLPAHRLFGKVALTGSVLLGKRLGVHATVAGLRHEDLVVGSSTEVAARIGAATETLLELCCLLSSMPFQSSSGNVGFRILS
jgi:hypothetical protein